MGEVQCEAVRGEGPDETGAVERRAASLRHGAARAAHGPAGHEPGAAALRRQAILDGPIVPTLLRLGLPTLVVLTVQAVVQVVEAYFVSVLGTPAIAGAALVFPIYMLMTTVANGGIGGGVSSAIARSLGAGRHGDANALASHALMLAVLFGLAFMLGAWAVGPWLYRAMGGEGAALQAALTYSNVMFIGAIPAWITALLSGALRGSGNVAVPAWVTFGGALIIVPLSPALIFGIGPVPGFGMAGAAAAVVIYFVCAAAVLAWYVARRGDALGFAPFRFAWHHFADIMGVGLFAALGAVVTNLTIMLVTASIGLFGTLALAAYGIGARLDYMLIPLLFGLGTAAITMVGTAIGAGRVSRARRVAWVSAGMGALMVGLIGALAALAPSLWTRLFTSDPEVLAAADLYLRTVAPFYAVYGAGLMLFFASQGAGKVMVPFLAGVVRLLVAGIGGWIAAHNGASLGVVFAIVAAALVLYGLTCVAAVALTRWVRRA